MGAKKKGMANKLAKMSDEDRARYLQHRADIEEEARRRKEQLISIFLKNKLKKEEAFSRLNVAKINQNWHQIMRKLKCKVMKEDVQNMKSQMERVLDLKNRTIKRLIKELDEADDQYGNNFQSHLNHITDMIDFGYKSLEEMHETYDTDREEILDVAEKDRRAFLKEAFDETVHLKTLIHQNGESSKKELRENYEHYFKKSDDVIRQNKEDFEMMRQQKESMIGDLWRRIADFLRGHVEATDVKRAHLAELQSLDAESAAEIARNGETIKRQEEEIEALEEQLEDLQKSRSEEIKQLAETTKTARREHLEAKINLKRDLDGDEKRIVFLTSTSNETIRHLEKLKRKGEKLLQVMQICRKYETQEEIILRLSSGAELGKYIDVGENGNGNGGSFNGKGSSDKNGGGGMSSDGSDNNGGDGMSSDGSDNNGGDGMSSDGSDNNGGDGMSSDGNDNHGGDGMSLDDNDNHGGDGMSKNGNDDIGGDGMSSDGNGNNRKFDKRAGCNGEVNKTQLDDKSIDRGKKFNDQQSSEHSKSFYTGQEFLDKRKKKLPAQISVEDQSSEINNILESRQSSEDKSLLTSQKSLEDQSSGINKIFECRQKFQKGQSSEDKSLLTSPKSLEDRSSRSKKIFGNRQEFQEGQSSEDKSLLTSQKSLKDQSSGINKIFESRQTFQEEQSSKDKSLLTSQKSLEDQSSRSKKIFGNRQEFQEGQSSKDKSLLTSQKSLEDRSSRSKKIFGNRQEFQEGQSSEDKSLLTSQKSLEDQSSGINQTFENMQVFQRGQSSEDKSLLTSQKSVEDRSSRSNKIFGNRQEFQEEQSSEDKSLLTSQKSLEEQSSKINKIFECWKIIQKGQSSEEKSLLTTQKSLEGESSEINKIFESRKIFQEGQSSEDKILITTKKSLEDQSSEINKILESRKIFQEGQSSEDKSLVTTKKSLEDQSSESNKILESRKIFQEGQSSEDKSLVTTKKSLEDQSSEINKILESRKIFQEGQSSEDKCLVTTQKSLEDQSSEINKIFDSRKIHQKCQSSEDKSVKNLENPQTNYEQLPSIETPTEKLNQKLPLEDQTTSTPPTTSERNTPTTQPEIVQSSHSSDCKNLTSQQIINPRKSEDFTTESKKLKTEFAASAKISDDKPKTEAGEIDEIKKSHSSEDHTSSNHSETKPKPSRRFSKIKAELEKHLSCEESSLKALEGKLRIGRSVRDTLEEMAANGKPLGATDDHIEGHTQLDQQAGQLSRISSTSLNQIEEHFGKFQLPEERGRSSSRSSTSCNQLDQTERHHRGSFGKIQRAHEHSRSSSRSSTPFKQEECSRLQQVKEHHGSLLTSSDQIDRIEHQSKLQQAGEHSKRSSRSSTPFKQEEISRLQLVKEHIGSSLTSLNQIDQTEHQRKLQQAGEHFRSSSRSSTPLKQEDSSRPQQAKEHVESSSGSSMSFNHGKLKPDGPLIPCNTKSSSTKDRNLSSTRSSKPLNLPRQFLPEISKSKETTPSFQHNSSRSKYSPADRFKKSSKYFRNSSAPSLRHDVAADRNSSASLNSGKNDEHQSLLRGFRDSTKSLLLILDDNPVVEISSFIQGQNSRPEGLPKVFGGLYRQSSISHGESPEEGLLQDLRTSPIPSNTKNARSSKNGKDLSEHFGTSSEESNKETTTFDVESSKRGLSEDFRTSVLSSIKPTTLDVKRSKNGEGVSEHFEASAVLSNKKSTTLDVENSKRGLSEDLRTSSIEKPSNLDIQRSKHSEGVSEHFKASNKEITSLDVESSKRGEELSEDFRTSSVLSIKTTTTLDVASKHVEDLSEHFEESDSDLESSKHVQALSEDSRTSSFKKPSTLDVESSIDGENYGTSIEQIVSQAEGSKVGEGTDFLGVEKLSETTKDAKSVSFMPEHESSKESTSPPDSSKRVQAQKSPTSFKNLGITALILDEGYSKRCSSEDFRRRTSSIISQKSRTSLIADEKSFFEVSKNIRSQSANNLQIAEQESINLKKSFDVSKNIQTQRLSVSAKKSRTSALIADEVCQHESADVKSCLPLIIDEYKSTDVKSCLPLIIDIPKNIRSQKVSKISRTSPVIADEKYQQGSGDLKNSDAACFKYPKSSPLPLEDQSQRASSTNSSSSSSNGDVSKNMHRRKYGLSSAHLRSAVEKQLRESFGVSKHPSGSLILTRNGSKNPSRGNVTKTIPRYKLSKSSKDLSTSRLIIKDSSPSSSDGNSDSTPNRKSKDSKPPIGINRRISKSSKGSSSSSLVENSEVHVMEDCFRSVQKLEGLWNAYNKVLLNCMEMRRTMKCLLEENECLKGVMRTVLEAAVLEKISLQLELGGNEKVVRNIHSGDAVYKNYNIKVLD